MPSRRGLLRYGLLGGLGVASPALAARPRDCEAPQPAWAAGIEGQRKATCLIGDRAYEVSVEIEMEGEVEGGLLLFFNRQLFLGMGHNGERMITYRGGRAGYWREPAPKTRRIHLKVVNDANIVTQYYSLDGQAWTRHGVRAETSGYQANTVDDLSSLRPGLFAAGTGSVRFRDFRYRALNAGAASR